jgi:hypothetical protein
MPPQHEQCAKYRSAWVQHRRVSGSSILLQAVQVLIRVRQRGLAMGAGVDRGGDGFIGIAG